MTYQRLPIYLKKILVAKNFSEELLNKGSRSEKKKIESLKTEEISSLESTISFLFQNKLDTLKDKCEKLQNTYLNYIGQIDNLRKEIENKDKIISKLSATPNLLFKRLNYRIK